MAERKHLLVMRAVAPHVIVVAAEPYPTVEAAQQAWQELEADRPPGGTYLYTDLVGSGSQGADE